MRANQKSGNQDMEEQRISGNPSSFIYDEGPVNLFFFS